MYPPYYIHHTYVYYVYIRHMYVYCISDSVLRSIVFCFDHTVRTRNLDATVLNIADGRLQYDDESNETNPPRARSLRARQEQQLVARVTTAVGRQEVRAFLCETLF